MAGDVSAALENRGWLYHPDYPDDWDRCSLYSLAQWVNGLAFRDIQFGSSGMPVIKIAEIKGGISGQTKFTEQTFDDSVRVRAGDLLFSWSGQPETSIDAFWWRGPEGWLNQHVFRVTPAEDIDPTFLFYLLRYLKPNFVGIARNKQTTGLGHVTKRDLQNIEAAYPESPEQRAIAHILGTLDDKIELNRRMSETLEAMARALFKSWFVDFDPVRTKMEGRDPGLPQPLADLFPARLVDSELGEIPEGWEVSKLGDLLELAYGRALKADDRCGGKIPVYGSNGQVGWHDARLVAGPGIVVGRKGNPGIATWVPTDFFPIDTTFYVVPKATCRSLTFLFHVLRTHDLASLGADSAVPGLNRNLAYMSRQVLPPASLLARFDRLASALSQRVRQANDESRTSPPCATRCCPSSSPARCGCGMRRSSSRGCLHDSPGPAAPKHRSVRLGRRGCADRTRPTRADLRREWSRQDDASCRAAVAGERRSDSHHRTPPACGGKPSACRSRL
jgi:type I restriction enzyme S subunit